MQRAPTIIVVDDRPDDGDLTALVLAAKVPFARVEVVTDAASFAAALAGDVAAVVTEHRLSWSDGPAIVGAVKKARPGCPVVLLTAAGGDAAVADALEVGLDGFIVRGSAGYLRLPVVLGRLLGPTAAREPREPARAAAPAPSSEETGGSTTASEGAPGTAGAPGNGGSPGAPPPRTAAAADDAALVAGLVSRAASLERSNRELQQFASVVSHDLQEPLNLTARFARMLAERCGGQLDDEATHYLSHVIGNTERMQTMIDDVLEYSRVESRGRPFAPVDVGGVVRRVLADLAVTVEARRADVVVDELPTVVADGRQLAQVFQNLIGNALKFCAEDAPQVRVSARETAEGWILSVRDNGIGIAPEDHGRIFEMFQRLHTESEYPGTGIGLAVCSRIVARHDGRIWVDSAPGRGSTFHVLIPHAAPDERPEPREARSPAAPAVGGMMADTARDPWSETH